MPADLIAYLRARIDQEEAERAGGYPDGWHTIRCGYDLIEWSPVDCDCGVPARVLADIALKRSILDAWEDASREPGPEAGYAWVLLRDVVIRPWLRPYAGRDDFNPAWATP